VALSVESARNIFKHSAESERLKGSKIEHFSGGGGVCNAPQDGVSCKQCTFWTVLFKRGTNPNNKLVLRKGLSFSEQFWTSLHSQNWIEV